MNAWTCPDGTVHKWTYLGKKAQAYRCDCCLVVVGKADLKKNTDEVLAVSMIEIPAPAAVPALKEPDA